MNLLVEFEVLEFVIGDVVIGDGGGVIDIGGLYCVGVL